MIGKVNWTIHIKQYETWIFAADNNKNRVTIHSNAFFF